MTLTRGQRLRRLRKSRGAEQQEVADALGVSQGYISMLERDAKGRNVAHIRTTLEKAAQYYGVSAEYLLAETPQEYIAAWTQTKGANRETFGQRLRLVLEELRARWGEEYDQAWLSAELGAPHEVVDGYLSDAVQVTDTVVEQISEITGAPVAWLVNRPAAAPEDPYRAFQPVLSTAVENGMEPDDLRLLVEAWLAGRRAKKPSGA